MRQEIRRGLVVNRHRSYAMHSMQLRSLRVRVRALAGSFLINFENVDPGSSAFVFSFRVYERCKKSTSPSGD